MKKYKIFFFSVPRRDEFSAKNSIIFSALFRIGVASVSFAAEQHKGCARAQIEFIDVSHKYAKILCACKHPSFTLNILTQTNNRHINMRKFCASVKIYPSFILNIQTQTNNHHRAAIVVYTKKLFTLRTKLSRPRINFRRARYESDLFAACCVFLLARTSALCSNFAASITRQAIE